MRKLRSLAKRFLVAVLLGIAFFGFSAGAPVSAENIETVCNGVILRGTQEQVLASQIRLGCVNVVPDGTYVNTTNQNVRSGPGTAYGWLASKSRNAEVTVDAVSTDRKWCRLSGETGWMACWLLAGVPEGLPVDDSLIVANARAAATPAATNSAPATTPASAPASTLTGTCEGDWPTTAERAKSYFGGGTWELSPEGGWHMFEVHDAISINPCGRAMEGYRDLKPGKDPYQFVTNGAEMIQGGTIWPNASLQELFCAMDSQKGHPTGDRAIHPIGFTPVACP